MFSERPAIWAHEPDAAFRSVDWANIAEGCGRRSDNEMARFVQIAMGSAQSSHIYLRLARDLELLSEASFDHLRSDLNEIMRMLSSLSQRVRPRVEAVQLRAKS